jgi:hypothetical protein
VSLPSVVLGFTVLLTLGALFLTSAQVGPGFLLYLAMLGPTAAWLIPGHVAIALPFGLFGGTLLAGAGPRSADRVQPREVIGLTFVLALVSLYIVGWLMPSGFQATGAATARFVNKPGSDRVVPVKPASLELPQLLSERADPAMSAELGRRVQLPLACLVLGLIGAGIIAAPFTWSNRTAVIVTLVLFIFQVRRWLEAWWAP